MLLFGVCDPESDRQTDLTSSTSPAKKEGRFHIHSVTTVCPDTSVISFNSHRSPMRKVLLSHLTGGETEAQGVQRWLVAELALELMSFDSGQG